MKGTRPLTTDEIIVVAQQFTGTFAVRNRSLFMLGVSVGGRISELLALTIGDVWQLTQLLVEGKEQSGQQESDEVLWFQLTGLNHESRGGEKMKITFEAKITPDGFIKIPPEYLDKLNGHISVTLCDACELKKRKREATLKFAGSWSDFTAADLAELFPRAFRDHSDGESSDEKENT